MPRATPFFLPLSAFASLFISPAISSFFFSDSAGATNSSPRAPPLVSPFEFSSGFEEGFVIVVAAAPAPSVVASRSPVASPPLASSFLLSTSSSSASQVSGFSGRALSTAAMRLRTTPAMSCFSRYLHADKAWPCFFVGDELAADCPTRSRMDENARPLWSWKQTSCTSDPDSPLFCCCFFSSFVRQISWSSPMERSAWLVQGR
mmetsp:Transcript_1590/g.3737  ORF Transcript_1590/g.3737 Transcript_1590/m.3737 type:complete len:204 (-) Transcript_1590:457-1068(-)